MAELFDLAVMRREIEEDEKLAEGRKRAKQSDYLSQDEIETMWRRKWDGKQRNENL
jgi:IS4 transposase